MQSPFITPARERPSAGHLADHPSRLAVEIEGLSKTFSSKNGPIKAVDNVSLSIPAGQVFGFLGPNGAGKTTTIKMMLGLVLPDTGRVRLNGYDVERERSAAVRQAGAVLEGAEVYRAVYIRAVNKLAEQLNSGVRAVAYDRAGVHNWCLILFYDVKELAGHTPDELTKPLDVSGGEVLDPDEPMEEAIRQAYLLDLDGFVQVSVDLSDDFDTFVTALYPVNEDDPLVAEVSGQPHPSARVDVLRLVREVSAFDGTILAVGSEYAVTWIDHHPPLAGLAAQPGDPVFAMTPPDALIVIEIPSAIRAESENCDPIPPFHLRDLEDETLDEYGEYFDWNAAQTAMHRAARELGKSAQIVNGYSNTVTSCDPESG